MSHSSQSFWKTFIPESVICLRAGYGWGALRKDLLAGVTVGVIALPLAMAFAIASGVAPERGLYTAIVAGFLISLLGGSRLQIGGPTGAFVVIIYSVVQRHGYDGLVLATLMAGALLVTVGLCRLGGLIRFIPYPLVIGFTSGIAVIIFSAQVKDFFGLQMGEVPAEFIPKWIAYFKALSTSHLVTSVVGSGTLAAILLLRKYAPRIPWGIASIVLVTVVVWALKIPVETIGSHFGTLPSTLLMPGLPEFSIDFSEWHALVPDALAIAFLAGVESLLSAMIADSMGGTRHNANSELVGQGLANISSVFFGGIPATGALARTAVNVKLGAKTPVSGMVHALTLLLCLFLFAPLVMQIPLAALAAVLIIVAWNMCEFDHFRHLFNAPAGDVGILLSAFLLTVFVDLTVAVEVGMVLAAFLFMQRMSGLAKVVPLRKGGKELLDTTEFPEGVEVYDIEGPLFFGAAESLKQTLHNISALNKVFILRLHNMYIIDASGLHALREFYYKCQRDQTVLLLSGLQKQPSESLKKFGLVKLIGAHHIFPHSDEALHRAKQLVSQKRPGIT